MSSVETQFHVPLFPPYPSSSRYVRVGAQDDALQRVRQSVEAWEAISLVIGAPGTGKSVISQVLQQYFSRDREVVVFGDATLESPLSLQRHLLSRLDRIRGISPTQPALGDDPQLAIIDRIANSSKEFAGLLLLVDEAQTLRPEVLETIRILTNVMTGGRPRVSAVLLGGPQLDETLALPSLDALVQRVATRCYLHPFTSDETVRYVRRALENGGQDVQVEIDDAAIRSIHRAGSGVPRLVNQLMTASISYANSKHQNRITTTIVEGAWSVLQQLPGPLVDEPELSRPVANVEFGPLSDHESSFAEFSEASPEKQTLDDATLDHADCEHNFDTCDADDAADEADFDTQSEIEFCSDDAADYGAVSYDCQSATDFDYDGMTSLNHGESAPCGSQHAAAATSAKSVSGEVNSPDELFGDFDEEEHVSDGIAGPKLHLADVAEIPGFTDHESAPYDLETALHREVQSMRAAAAPVLWVEDADDDELVHDDRDMLIIEDDLEVENTMVIHEVRVDAPSEQSVAIDFHAMLAKMRAPKR